MIYRIDLRTIKPTKDNYRQVDFHIFAHPAWPQAMNEHFTPTSQYQVLFLRPWASGLDLRLFELWFVTDKNDPLHTEERASPHKYYKELTYFKENVPTNVEHTYIVDISKAAVVAVG